MKNNIKNLVLILLICSLQSCSNITHIPIPVAAFNRNEGPTLSPEEQPYFDALTEKHLEEVSACKHLGTATGEGGGGLEGRWRAKKLVKYEAAKHKADAVVFGPDPAWEFSKTLVTGSFYQCHATGPSD